MRKNNQKSGNLFAGFKIMRTFASLLKGSTLTKEFGEVAEWSIAAVLKPLYREVPGFESLSLR